MEGDGSSRSADGNRMMDVRLSSTAGSRSPNSAPTKMQTCGVLSAVNVLRTHGCGVVPIKPLSIIGGVLAILFFVSTVSFLFTAPGVSESAGLGFHRCRR